MKLAILQLHITWENKEDNLSKLRGFLEELKLRDEMPELIILPEMSFTGFSMNLKYTAETDMYTVKKCTEMAETYDVSIGFGYVKGTESEAAKCENHYVIVSQEGKIILDYIKFHPFSYGDEDKYFDKGDKVYCCNIGDFNIGSVICYDLRFPEPFQVMSEVCDLIIVPANWAAERVEHFIALNKARAIENQCYIAAVNCVGDMNNEYFSGDSRLYDPDGHECVPYTHINLYESDLFLFEQDNNVGAVRNAFPMKKDRREELYKILHL